MMKIRLILADIVFWLHVAIGIIWYGLFFVPISLWYGKITFHFHLTLIIVLHQIIWGLAIMPWTHKFRMVCILTTLMQLLRGQKISDSKNYDHSFFQEFFGKQGIKISHSASTLITFSILTLVTLQFIFLR